MSELYRFKSAMLRDDEEDPPGNKTGPRVTGEAQCDHEVQECEAGETEANLKTHWTHGTKNPSHKGFIPWSELNKNHDMNPTYHPKYRAVLRDDEKDAPGNKTVFIGTGPRVTGEAQSAKFPIRSQPFHSLCFLQGDHEVQECEAGETEANLKTHWTHLTKNPSHKGFIPMCEFNENHDMIQIYHPKYREELCKLIKLTADLTVRISVTHTSLARPNFIENTVKPYPCSNSRGKNSLRTGTGMIVGVTKFQEEDKKTCPCEVCRSSDTPMTTWWVAGVMTATHVVFDTSEAETARCRLFFDSQDSPLVMLDGWRMWDMTIKGDTCRFSCASHDMALYEKMSEIFTRYLHFQTNFDDVLTYIVSHPHGCFKHVSIGIYEKKEMTKAQLWYRASRYHYKLSTCAGSSGAFVFTNTKLLVPHVHSGSKGKCNYSGEGFEDII
ncbi:uncharacterized protein LOC131939852 isoform X2 [Physella acuta]|uniref:uncharacterized protein LOC131939852 isoform X2 n=1 Tax=Physella acuta TaxID=109671 RepID=UPI0027DBAD59|nr:uncharacterized protein LOC131939852 isoform X2 [Physella acuta]